MISAFALACALHPFFCHSAPARAFAAAVDAEVQDDRLRAVLVVYAAHESGITPDPAPQSWDSRAKVSCGYLQMRCGFVRTHLVREQVRAWLYDLQRGQYGLAGICGSGPAATRMAYRRAREAERLLDLVGAR